MQPKLILTSRTAGDDYRAAIAFAREHHFDGIDWNLDFFRIPAASHARKVFVDAAQNSGLPSRFHGPCQDIELAHADPQIAGAALAYLKMYIDFLKVFPDAHFNLHIGSRSIPESELSWETALHNLEELVAYGKEHGVTVCLENLKQGWTSIPEKLAALVETSGAMLTLDIGHARACLARAQSRLSVKDYIAPYVERIRDIHLYEIESPDGRHLEPLNLERIGPILNYLLEQGITWWVIELKDNAAIIRTKQLLEREYFARFPSDF